LAGLEAANRKLAASASPEAVMKRDDAWHLELLADCPNPVLIGLIKQFIYRTRRYELALMRDHFNVQHAIRDHYRIVKALRKGNLAEACQALKRNMESGKETILAWLRNRASH
jgi:DNA-binding GntR family transcriptional regulator